MQLVVPTVMTEAVVTKLIETGDSVWKIGELIELPYGIALQLRALQYVGGFKNEDAKHAEATESLQIYGGDSWFAHRSQTIRRVAEYLAEQGNTPQRLS